MVRAGRVRALVEDGTFVTLFAAVAAVGLSAVMAIPGPQPPGAGRVRQHGPVATPAPTATPNPGTRGESRQPRAPGRSPESPAGQPGDPFVDQPSGQPTGRRSRP